MATASKSPYLPAFEFQEESLASSLDRAPPDLGFLLVWSLVLFAAAYFRFLRHDVRYTNARRPLGCAGICHQNAREEISLSGGARSRRADSARKCAAD